MTNLTVDILTYPVPDLANPGSCSLFFQGACAGVQDNTAYGPEVCYGSIVSSYDDPANALYTSLASMLANNYAFKAAQVVNDYTTTFTYPGYTFVLGTNYNYDVSLGEDYINAYKLVNTKYTTPTGTTSQYIRGDGTLATLPVTPALSFNNTPGRSIVTGTGATGFQVSSTRNAIVNYSVTINTSVSLSGNAVGYVVLEIAATNSATAGDWVEVGRAPSGQSGTLVIGLALNQAGGGQMGAVIPAGYYAKLRSVNSTGTPTYTYNSGQEVLM